jgi:hypothetical protein
MIKRIKVKPCLCRKCGVRACQPSKCMVNWHYCSRCIRKRYAKAVNKYEHSEKGKTRNLKAARRYKKTFKGKVKSLALQKARRIKYGEAWKEQERYRSLSRRRRLRIEENRL